MLLETNLFENNEYLDKYCQLIEDNENTIKEKYKTHSHHIIPKCYYKLVGESPNNSISNRVNLLYKDHILAHYYLCYFTSDSLKGKMCHALFHLINITSLEELNLEYIDFNQLQQFYEKWREESSTQLKGIKKGPMSANIKKKISNSTKGRTSPNKGKKFSKEVCDKISKSKKGIQFSDETKHKISEGRKGKCGYKLTPRSEDTKLKISLARRGKKHKNPSPLKGTHLSEEQKLKISNANKGRKLPPMSEEHKLKISQALKGHKVSEGKKEKMKKPIFCVETNVYYSSIKEAMSITGFSSISIAVKNGRTAGGYHWKYVRKEDIDEIKN